MSQRRLNNLMILSIYKEEVDNLDMKCIVNDFIKNGDVKRTNAFSLIKYCFHNYYILVLRR